MKITTNDLDKRICDVEEDATNTQTYREFIRETEEMLDIQKMNIDLMTETELNNHLDWLDDMWDK